jgi:arabinose-5-phosphate isomerase
MMMEQGRLVVQRGAEALAYLGHVFPESFSEVMQRLYALKGRIICSGIGKSGHIAKKVSSTFSSMGSPSFFLHPTEALHGDLGAIIPEDALLLFSNSGETEELLELLQHARVSVCIVITSHGKSSLALASDVVLTMPVLEEACPLGLAPSTSTLMMLSLGDALALTLSSLKGFEKDHYHRLHPSGALGQQLLTVGQMMQVPAPVVPEDAAYDAILQAMVQHCFGCIGLVSAEGILTGVLTDQHIPMLLSGNALNLERPVVAYPGMRGLEALALMKQHDVQTLFVVNEHQVPQGMIGKTLCMRSDRGSSR